MQQYFVSETLSTGDEINLDKDILYHLVKVLRKDSTYTFRIVDQNGSIFHASLSGKDTCLIKEKLDEDNELSCDITCILSLIKSDKLELCIQKLVELGVRRIVLYNARRSVMKIKDEKKLQRLSKIALEAAEQSHRNIVPQVLMPISIKQMKDYMSEKNYICYESERNIADIPSSSSITYIIGPEGGFEDKEYEQICALGFESISLGKRILRAETAALYMTSVIVSKCQ
ncbi:MAG: 16S rRNA (uracil(1498)-N(3))-methyltransferase [Erysipelotrichaceae bacterium]|nr:16S rRNA (uracil(1498)-N(3))-methyltransferase [Erysipelotrichaceae bacterium]